MPNFPAMALFSLALLSACGDGESTRVDPIYEVAGPHGVGNTTIELVDGARGRTMNVEIWYPRTDTVNTGEALEVFVVDPEDKSSFEELLSEAPASCPSTTTGSTRDAEALTGTLPLPLLVFSHCHNCVRFSSFAIAERLASHGFVVAAPDHTGNTLFDDLAEEGVALDSEFLQVRAADISFVIDSMLAGDGGIAINPEQIGVYGHSFGAVTTGLVLQDDPRPIAGFAIASPMENPLVTGVELDNISDPVGFLVAVEDNSITEIGNLFIRQNFEEARSAAWKGEVADAGHWSFSDICGLHPQFSACCGEDARQTDGEPFTYVPVETGIAIAQAYVTAFFAAHVLNDENAMRYLEEERFAGQVSIEAHDATN